MSSQGDRRIILVGAGPGGRFTREICLALGREVHGFVDDFVEVETKIHGIPVLGEIDLINDSSIYQEFDIVVSMGHPDRRAQVYYTLADKGVRLATLIHPAAVVSPTAQIGDGVIINGPSAVCADTRIEDLVLVEDMSSVGVDCVLEFGCLLGNGVTMGGASQCLRESYIGTNVTIVVKKTVGRRAYIGAGAVVSSDIPDGKLAVGVPARVIKDSPYALNN